MNAHVMPIEAASTRESAKVRFAPNLFRRIVLATAETRACQKAALMAKAIAEEHGAEILVAESLPVYPLDLAKAEKAVRGALIGLRKWTKRMRLDPFVSERIVVREEPASTIAKALRTEPAELVVMGTHGSKGFERLLLGSVAEELARENGVFSLIVGPECANDFQRFARFRKVLFATDLTAPSFAALALLRRLQAATAPHVFVLHAIDSDDPDPVRRYERRMEVRSLLFHELAGLNVSAVIVEDGKPTELIRAFSEFFDVDAVVLGIRRGSEFTRAATHLHSLTSKIINQARSPVFTVAGSPRASERS